MPTTDSPFATCLSGGVLCSCEQCMRIRGFLGTADGPLSLCVGTKQPMCSSVFRIAIVMTVNMPYVVSGIADSEEAGVE